MLPIDDARIAACAAGEAAWHAAAYAGLGADWDTGFGLARAVRRVPHPFLLGAVTLEPAPPIPDDLNGEVCDSWAALSLGDGWTSSPADPWMYRPPGGFAPVETPAGLTVAPTRDALLFERVAFLGAAGRLPRVPGELHPPGSEQVAGLTLLLAHVDGTPVGTALAVTHSAGVVVSAVSVLAEYRRQGIGAALTVAAAQCAPDRPATLSASGLGRGTYARLGFVELGRPLHWRQS